MDPSRCTKYPLLTLDNGAWSQKPAVLISNFPFLPRPRESLLLQSSWWLHPLQMLFRVSHLQNPRGSTTQKHPVLLLSLHALFCFWRGDCQCWLSVVHLTIYTPSICFPEWVKYPKRSRKSRGSPNCLYHQGDWGTIAPVCQPHSPFPQPQ